MFKKFIWLIVALLICIYPSSSFASLDGPRFMPGLFLLLDDSVSIPNTPTGLKISAHSPSALTLDWTDVSNNENGFSIFMSTTQFGTYSYIDSVSANTTTYLVSGLTPSTTYWFKVTAYNTVGESDFSNSAYATTVTSTTTTTTQPTTTTTSTTTTTTLPPTTTTTLPPTTTTTTSTTTTTTQPTTTTTSTTTTTTLPPTTTTTTSTTSTTTQPTTTTTSTTTTTLPVFCESACGKPGKDCYRLSGSSYNQNNCVACDPIQTVPPYCQ